MLNPGDKAPDFVGQDHTGKTVKLGSPRARRWFSG